MNLLFLGFFKFDKRLTLGYRLVLDRGTVLYCMAVLLTVAAYSGEQCRADNDTVISVLDEVTRDDCLGLTRIAADLAALGRLDRRHLNG